MRSIALLSAATILAILAYAALPRSGMSANGLYAVDGDTLRDANGTSYRLLGYDAPETYESKCAAERQRGLAARTRLQALTDLGSSVLTDSGRRDHYNRILATLTVNGKDVAAIMIGEHLARPYHGGRRNGWCNPLSGG